MGEDFSRYVRQTSIEEIGHEGQKKLSQSKVFVVGCGALGSMVSMQIAGAGVGTIGIADFDTIDHTNLQRQFFFRDDEAGRGKARILEEKIKGLNPETIVNVFNELVTEKRGDDVLKDYDVIVDATDNQSSKLMIDKICEVLAIPMVTAGVASFHGQATTILPGQERYSELFSDIKEETFLPCSLGGVMGPAAALCASIQSSEVIKIITGAGDTLSGKLFVFDLLSNSFTLYSL